MRTIFGDMNGLEVCLFYTDFLDQQNLVNLHVLCLCKLFSVALILYEKEKMAMINTFLLLAVSRLTLCKILTLCM